MASDVISAFHVASYLILKFSLKLIPLASTPHFSGKETEALGG